MGSKDLNNQKFNGENGLSLNLLRSVVGEANDAVLITKAEPIGAPDGPEIIYANKSFERMSGYKAEEVIGKTPRMLQGPGTSTEELRKLRKALREQKPVEAELLNYTKSGEEYWVSLSISPVFENGVCTHFISIQRNVTEQVKARKAVEEANERFEYALKASEDVLYDHDMAGDTILLSENFQQIFGYTFTDEPFSLEKWATLLHPDDEERINSRIGKILADKNANKWEAEFRYKKSDGTYADVREKAYIIRDKTGKPVRMVGVVKDITEEKQRELKKELSAKISRIFNESEDVSEALTGTLQELSKHESFQIAEIWMVNNDSKKINLAAYLEKDARSFYKIEKEVESFKKGEGLPGKTWKSRKTELWKNLDTRKSFIRRKGAAKAGLKTAYGFPIIYNDDVIGVLLLGTGKLLNQKEPFTGVLEALSDQLGEEIRRKKLEEELSRIYESAPDGILVAGFDGYFKKVNPAMCSMLGYSNDELLSRSYFDFVHPDDRDKTRKFYEEVNAGAERSGFENRYITKSGQVIWLSWSFKTYPQEKIAYTVAKNITIQKELEELIKLSNKLARIGSWEVDLVKNKMYWTDITKEIHEVEPDFEPDLETGINFYKEGEDRDKITEAVKLAIEKGEGWDLELKVVTAKGNERWVRAIGEAQLVDGACIRLFGSFQDIHDMKLAQKRIDNIADNLPGVIFQYWLTPDGKDSVRFLSDGSLDVWGVTAEDAMEDFDRVWAYAHKDDVEAIRKSIIESAESLRRWHHIWRYNHPDGKLRWQEGFGTPQKLDDGTVFWDSIILDITEKKELEELLSQSSKMAKVGSWNIDLENGQLYWSETVREIFGVDSTEQLNPDNVFDFIPLDPHREMLQAAARNATESGESYDLEIMIRSTKGENKWIRTIGEPEFSNGKCIRVYGSVQDIHDRKSSEIELESKSRHIEAISRLKSALLDYQDWQNALSENLQVIGETAGADRVYYFENHYDPETGEGFTSQKLEWCREGITTQKDNPDLIDVPFSEVPEYINDLKQGKPSNWRISEFDEGSLSYHVMESQEIQSFMLFPVYVDGRFHGFLGFDNCTSERLWSDEEISILETITANLATAISRQQQDEKLQELLDEKNTILESISDAFYAVDQNWNITYFNKEAEKELQRSASEVLGEKIWEMFPPSPKSEVKLEDVYRQVIKNKEKQSLEYFSQRLQAWYDLSIYPSGNGVSVYFKNITERKREQQLIEQKTSQLDAIARFNGMLINEESWFEALRLSFEMFGEITQADRVYFFENKLDARGIPLTTTMTLEWSKKGIEPQTDNPDHTDLPVGVDHPSVGLMAQNKPFAAIVDEIEDETFKKILKDQDIKSVLSLPVFVGGLFYGFIGFDDCTKARLWGDEVIAFLQTIAINLASAIENEQAEKALEEAFKQKNEILESIGDAFFAVDNDWTVTYWNNKAVEFLGMPKDKIIGKNLWEMYDDAIELEFYGQYHKAVDEQVTVQFEEYYPATGTWFEVSAYPSASGLSVFFKDITEKYNAVREIELSNERFLKVAEVSKDAIWDYEAKKETLIWGDGFKKLFGYDPETFGNKLENWENRIHEDDRERVKKSFRAIMTEKSGNVWESEYRFLKSDGEYAYIQDKGSVIRNEAGEVIRVVGSMSDVTEQKEAEDRLRSLNESLKKQADELAASNAELEQFAFVASHDLQEPLRMITSFLAQIERKYNDVLDDKGRKYIHFATDGARRMRQIILDLLEYSRVGRVDNEREEVNMNEILQNILILHRKKMEESGASVKADSLPVISASRGAMQQLLQNLVSNALNYQEPDNKPEIEIRYEDLNEEWKFCVKDNGIGIDPQYQEKIFNIFQRLHGREEYSGTGVGLAICKKIVEDHGGRIWVESELDKGSTFYFTIKKRD